MPFLMSVMSGSADSIVTSWCVVRIFSGAALVLGSPSPITAPYWLFIYKNGDWKAFPACA